MMVVAAVVVVVVVVVWMDLMVCVVFAVIDGLFLAGAGAGGGGGIALST